MSPLTEEDIQRISSTLESISKGFPPDSQEVLALKEAGEAFVFLALHTSLKSAYEAFRAHSRQPLSPSQIEHLRSMGIEP